ncbi:MAG: M36 family metallopeptidase [candidate division Zixibacteria bacterium]|nr:M36 family metallopeptidase [candidate division Zixibacteria bacterium]
MKIASAFDRDGDGYARIAQLAADIDILPAESSAVVYVEIFGREPSWGGYLWMRSQQFPIFGNDAVYEEFALEDLPHGNWDFRIDVYTYTGLLVASSYFGQFPYVVAVQLETAAEDAQITYFDAYADGLLDWDGDGFFCTTLLTWALKADAGTHMVYSELYISDGASEWFLPTTAPYPVMDTNHVWQGLFFAGMPLGEYDIRMVVFEEGTNRFLVEFPYGAQPAWTNIRLETGREDKGPSQVFNPNPVNTLNDPCLWDDNDAASAVPSAAYQVVELDSLNEPPLEDGFYQLSGAYANIADIRPPEVPSPLLPGPSYAYTRDQAGFEATMAYHHITENQEYIQGLNLGYGVCDRQVNVDVFGSPGGSDATAEYIPSPPGSGYIVIGLGGSGGSPGVDGAEDADVIMHEYGHAILDNIAPATFGSYGYNDEPLWVNEGFANYWAASSTFGASLAHGFPPEYVGEWYVKNAPGCEPAHGQYGNVENQWTMDSISSYYPHWEEHRCGQIWSAALWDMLQTLSKTIADRIIIDGHRSVWVARMVDFGMRDVVPKLLRADSILYGAGHAQQIMNIFAARGINVSAPCDCPHQGDINGDLSIDVFDVIAAIAIAFSGDPDVQDPACPITRTDVNNDAAVNLFDVIYLIDHQASGGPAPLDPCAP